jgi:hypothetical protein
MDLSFFCANCGQHILIDDSAVGMKVNCPRCAAQLEVPHQSISVNAGLVPSPPGSPRRKSRGRVIAACAVIVVIIASGVAVELLRPDLPSSLVQSLKQLSQRFGGQGKAAAKKDSPAVASARARLELARQKSDLDGMFLALKELQALGQDSPGMMEELANIGAAIPLLQKVRVYQGDHNHEEVIKAAGLVLDRFPEHPEARKALKESGLIFGYLQDALSSLSGCFAKDDQGKFDLVQIKVRIMKDMTDMPDFAKIFYNLDKAEKSLEAAKNLDPHFDQALALEKLVSDTKNTVGFEVGMPLAKCDGILADTYISAFQSIYSAMEVAVQSGRPISAVWVEGSKVLQQLEDKAEFKNLFDLLDRLSSYLAYFKAGTASEFLQTVKEIHSKMMQLKSAVANPTGSMIEYRRDVGVKRTQLLDLIGNLKTSTPNENTLADNVVGFATVAVKYELFKTPAETKPVIEKYKGLISA